MKSETRRAKLAELLGIEVAEEESPQQEKERHDLDALIYYTVSPEAFIQLECLNCDKTFAVNRKFVHCCSDHCRASYLTSIGINTYDLGLGPSERWAKLGGEPVIVKPEWLGKYHQVMQEQTQLEIVSQLAEQPEQVDGVQIIDDLDFRVFLQLKPSV